MTSDVQFCDMVESNKGEKTVESWKWEVPARQSEETGD